MYRPSDEFLNEMGKHPYRFYLVKDQTEIEADQCTLTSCWCGGDFALGTAVSAELKATLRRETMPFRQGDRFRAEVCMEGMQERIPMGTFTVFKMDRETDTDCWQLSARDAMAEALEQPYGQSGVQSSRLVLQDICRRSGLTTDAVLPEDGAITVDGKSMRTLLGGLALQVGGNARIDRTGVLKLDPFLGYQHTVGPEDYYESKLRVEQQDYVLGVLEVECPNVTYQRQKDGYTRGLRLKGEMTEQIFNEIWMEWEGAAFRPGQIELVDGFLIDPGDAIRVRDVKNNEYLLPVFQLVCSFDGGFRTRVTARMGEGEKALPPRPVSEVIQGLQVDLGRFKRIQTEELEAQSAAVKQLQADVVKARTILVEKEDGTEILRADADTGELVATSGRIGGMSLSDHALTATYRHDYPTYTQADIDRVRRYIIGTETLTKEEIEKYDVNMDGKITGGDVLGMQKLFHGTVPPYSIYRVTLDPSNPRKCLEIEVTEGYHKGWKSVLNTNGLATRDLTVSGQVFVRDRELVDFVVEKGSDEQGWTWYKWDSGRAECWGKFRAGGSNQATGAFYWSYQGVPYPTALFSEPPCTTGTAAYGPLSGVCSSGSTTKDKWLGYLWTSTNDAPEHYVMNLRAVGRWR